MKSLQTSHRKTRCAKVLSLSANNIVTIHLKVNRFTLLDLVSFYILTAVAVTVLEMALS